MYKSIQTRVVLILTKLMRPILIGTVLVFSTTTGSGVSEYLFLVSLSLFFAIIELIVSKRRFNFRFYIVMASVCFFFTNKIIIDMLLNVNLGLC